MYVYTPLDLVVCNGEREQEGLVEQVHDQLDLVGDLGAAKDAADRARGGVDDLRSDKQSRGNEARNIL